MDLENFIRSSSRNQYIEVGSYSIYVRRGFHRVNGNSTRTFDIANVVNIDESNRGNGGFRVLLSCFEKRLKGEKEFEAIFIENVLNPRLASSLPDMGYCQMDGSDPPSFVRFL